MPAGHTCWASSNLSLPSRVESSRAEPSESSQVERCGASQVELSRASEAQSSEAQSSDAQSSEAQSSDAQSSEAQSSEAGSSEAESSRVELSRVELRRVERAESRRRADQCFTCDTIRGRRSAQSQPGWSGVRGRGAGATSAEMAAPVMIALGVARRLAQVRTTTFMVSRMVGGRHLGGARGSEWRRTRVRVARERLSGRHARATALTRDRARL